MILRKDVSTELSLNIAGYQFPHLAKDWDDGNWLNVSIQVKHPKGNWKKIDACLETFELKQLIEWFEKIAKNEEVKNQLNFIEPCLAFEFIKSGENKIRVFFSHELAPPWVKNFEEFFIDFLITEKEIKRAVADLREQSEKFPVRGKSKNGRHKI